MNAEPTFTPGPWFRVWNGHFHDICKEEREYAQSLGSTHVNGPLGIGTAEARANARLIAAAPDLFEALEIAVEYFESMGSARGIANIGRAALSKASPGAS